MKAEPQRPSGILPNGCVHFTVLRVALILLFMSSVGQQQLLAQKVISRILLGDAFRASVDLERQVKTSFVHSCRDGGFLVVGYSIRFVDSLQLIRFNAYHDEVWRSSLPRMSMHLPVSVIETVSGDFFLILEQSDVQLSYEWITADGKLIDYRPIADQWLMSTATIPSVEVENDGRHFYVGAVSRTQKIRITCVNESGEKSWSTILSDVDSSSSISSNRGIRSLRFIATNRLAASVMLLGDSVTNDRYFVIFVDTTGRELWQTEIHLPEDLYSPRIVSMDDDSSMYVTAQRSEAGNRYSVLHISKIDRAGNVLWTRRLASEMSNGNFARTPDGGMVIASTSGDKPADYPPSDAMAIRLDAEYRPLWLWSNEPALRHWEDTVESEVSNVYVKTSGNIVIGGNYLSGVGPYRILDGHASVGIVYELEDTPTSVSAALTRSSFDGRMQVRYDPGHRLVWLTLQTEQAAGASTISFYDLSGRLVKSDRSAGTLFNDTLREERVSVVDLPPGCYIATVSLGSEYQATYVVVY